MSCTALKIAILGGTGRMGIPLAANWANSGFDVLLTSRDKSRAQSIVDKLKTGTGLRMNAVAGGGVVWSASVRCEAAAKNMPRNSLDTSTSCLVCGRRAESFLRRVHHQAALTYAA